mgnify:FL=1
MDVQLSDLQKLIDLLKANSVGYYKDDSIELRFVPEKLETSLPPPKNKKRQQQDDEDLLFWSAG